MNSKTKRRFIVTRLTWCIKEPTTAVSSGITAYEKHEGVSGIFSVYVQFSDFDLEAKRWRKAKVYALVQDMEGKLPKIGGTLVLTAGRKPVAEAEVIAEGEDVV